MEKGIPRKKRKGTTAQVYVAQAETLTEQPAASSQPSRWNDIHPLDSEAISSLMLLPTSPSRPTSKRRDRRKNDEERRSSREESSLEVSSGVFSSPSSSPHRRKRTNPRSRTSLETCYEGMSKDESSNSIDNSSATSNGKNGFKKTVTSSSNLPLSSFAPHPSTSMELISSQENSRADTSLAVHSPSKRKRKEGQAPKTSTIPVDESQSSSTLSSWNWKESLLTRRNRKSSSLVVQISNDTDGVDSEDISSIFPLSTLSAASLDSAGAHSSFETENTRAHRSERYAPLHASLSPHGDVYQFRGRCRLGIHDALLAVPSTMSQVATLQSYCGVFTQWEVESCEEDRRFPILFGSGCSHSRASYLRARNRIVNPTLQRKNHRNSSASRFGGSGSKRELKQNVRFLHDWFEVPTDEQCSADPFAFLRFVRKNFGKVPSVEEGAFHAVEYPLVGSKNYSSLLSDSIRIIHNRPSRFESESGGNTPMKTPDSRGGHPSARHVAPSKPIWVLRDPLFVEVTQFPSQPIEGIVSSGSDTEHPKEPIRSSPVITPLVSTQDVDEIISSLVAEVSQYTLPSHNNPNPNGEDSELYSTARESMLVDISSLDNFSDSTEYQSASLHEDQNSLHSDIVAASEVEKSLEGGTMSASSPTRTSHQEPTSLPSNGVAGERGTLCSECSTTSIVGLTLSSRGDSDSGSRLPFLTAISIPLSKTSLVPSSQPSISTPLSSGEKSDVQS